MPKLSKRTVDAIRPDPAGRDVFVWDTGDGALKGFGVRMKPSGAATYLVLYRTKEGRTRRLAIGKVGVLTPDEAAHDRQREAQRGGERRRFIGRAPPRPTRGADDRRAGRPVSCRGAGREAEQKASSWAPTARTSSAT